MGNSSATGYALVPSKVVGYPNQGPWNSRLTDYAQTAEETVGVLRQEGANTYMYVQFGTAAIASAGLPVKPASGLTDIAGNISPINVIALGATAAGYLSAMGVTISTTPSGGATAPYYGWIAVAGIGTLPLNSNTAGLAFGVPVAPSSSSAGFAECAAGSSVGRACTINGATLGTATQTAQGGILCKFNFLRTFTG